jgi:hypothetical protein
MESRTAKVLASFLLLPVAAAGGAVVHSCGSPRAEPAGAKAVAEPVEAPVPVFLGSGGGLRFALAPAFPEPSRASFDAGALGERLAIPGARFARLFVFRLDPGTSTLDVDALTVEATTHSGEPLSLDRLATLPMPPGPREALVFRALRGPRGVLEMNPESSVDLWLVLPRDRDLDGIAGAKLSSPDTTLERRSVLPRDLRAFLEEPTASFFGAPGGK